MYSPYSAVAAFGGARPARLRTLRDVDEASDLAALRSALETTDPPAGAARSALRDWLEGPLGDDDRAGAAREPAR